MNKTPVDLFLRSCGVAGPFELEIQGPGWPGSRRVKIAKPFAVIGRYPQADVFLDHPDISRRHAYLQVIGGRVFCMDLESRGGLRWGDVLEPAGWLDPEFPVFVGPYRIHLFSDPTQGYRHGPDPAARENPLGLGSTSPPPFPGGMLEINMGTSKKPFWRPRRVLTVIGNSPACDLKLVSPVISAIHASLVFTQPGTWVIDLLGRNGIDVNGKRVRFSALKHGDEIRIGRAHIRLHETDPTPSPPAPGNGSEQPENGRAPLPVKYPPVARTTPGESSPGETASLLLPLLDQFGSMQQQLVEQFQQSMMMMARMFGAMHRDQAELLQEVLNRLDQTNRELQTLKGERAMNAPALPAPGLRQGPTPAPLLADLTGMNGKAAVPPPPSGERPGPASLESTPVSSSTPPDPHAFLNQRIASIQQEQKTCWQKILGFLGGKQPKGEVP